MQSLRTLSLCLVLVLLLSSCSTLPDAPLETSSAIVQTTTASMTTSPKDDGIYIERINKEVKNILMIGNSNCYYYVEELCGIASAAGKDINLCNLYYSGCSLERHWSFYSNNSNDYELWYTKKNAHVNMGKKTFIEALEFANKYLNGNWDVISLQQTGYYTLIGSAESAKPYTLPYAKNLFNVLRENCPDATIFWHQQWAYEVGYGENKSDKREHVDSLEKQTEQHNAIKELAYMVAKAEGINVIPTGDAWNIARKNELIGQTLCARKGVNNDRGDCDHDGDIGGGQYLNACVWFEILMGESCIGNTWRPSDYELSEEKIEVLQRAAHEAVAAVYGPAYAR